MLLEVKDLNAGYGNKQILHNTEFVIGEKEVVALLGHNGAGKTTTLQTLIGLHKGISGKILFRGEDIFSLSASDIVKKGVALSPQGHGVFPKLTVEENLELGAYTVKDKAFITKRMQEIYDLFPILHERRKQRAGTMSGGQQQMVAIGVSLMSNPKLLLMDEPSIGLAPVLVQKVLETAKEITQRFDASVLLVEQNVTQTLKVADRVYIMKMGQIVSEEKASDLTVEKLWDLY